MTNQIKWKRIFSGRYVSQCARYELELIEEYGKFSEWHITERGGYGDFVGTFDPEYTMRDAKQVCEWHNQNNPLTDEERAEMIEGQIETAKSVLEFFKKNNEQDSIKIVKAIMDIDKSALKRIAA
jgi:hypothetical protein